MSQLDNDDTNEAVQQDENRRVQKKRKDYQLDIIGLFQADAGYIIASRQLSNYLHKGGNIRSAGDEVEAAVREYYRRRLPTAYTVHHGHFLDRHLSLSSQMDIIIADNTRFPAFFRGQEGMEYMPYEGVYAFGEIKSSLTNKNVSDFINRTREILDKLDRENVSDGYADAFKFDEDGTFVVYPRPERGDIYRFIFGVTSKNFNLDKCLSELCNADPRYAPNAIILLDKGVITAARARKIDGRLEVIYVHPQKKRDPKNEGQVDGWALIETNNNYKEGSTLFYGYTLLLEHLKNAVLLPTNYINYAEKFLKRTTRFLAMRQRGDEQI